MVENTISRDYLTGLYVRQTMDEIVNQEIQRSIRHKQEFAVVMLDINHFKSVNDAYGHGRGDQVLKEFAHFLQMHIREKDWAFRYGGDEFILLFPQTPKMRGVLLAQRLVEQLGNTSFVGDPPLFLAASVGVSSYPEDGKTPAELVEVADRRHYAAKRSRYTVVYDEGQGDDIGGSDLSRLIERETALDMVSGFLNLLQHNRRGILQISGPMGGGKTQFLSKVHEIASLRGIQIIEISGNSCKKSRVFSALSPLRSYFPDMSVLWQERKDFIDLFSEQLRLLKTENLLFLVDDRSDVDPASLDMIRDLYYSLEVTRLGIVYTQVSNYQGLEWLADAPFRQKIYLGPFSEEGTALWVRQHLRWEPPVEFTRWLTHGTRGIPKLIEYTLDFLLKKDFLTPARNGYQYSEEIFAFPLDEQLENFTNLPVNNVQPPLDEFFDLDFEVDNLCKNIHSQRLTCLVGPGGAGKTRLAIQIAIESIQDFPDGVWFVPLISVSSSENLISSIAQVLHVNISKTGPLRKDVLNHLATKSLLLVLDNFEHLLSEAGFIEDILSRSPQVRIIVTSRVRLGLPEEKIIERSGLKTPASVTQRSAILTSSAVQYFIHQSQQSPHLFNLTEQELKTIARICRLLGGNPLGIELAAAWVKTFTLEEIAGYIETRLLEADDKGLGRPAINVSIIPMLDSLWDMFSEYERSVLRRMALFRGEFSRQAATQISGASPFLLDSLQSKAYLGSARQGWLTIHEMIRQYALERLKQNPVEMRRTIRKFCQYYAEFSCLNLENLKGKNQLQSIRDFSEALDNIHSALNWALKQKKWDEIAALIEPLFRFYEIRSFFDEGRVTFQTVTHELARYKNPEARQIYGFGLGCLGWFYGRQGNYHKAHIIIQKGLSILRESRSSQYLALVLNQLGYIKYFLNDPHTEAVFEESLTLLKDEGDLWGEGFAYNYLANYYWVNRNYEVSRHYYSLSLEKRRKIGDLAGIAITLNNLGYTSYQAGNFEEAEKIFLECLDLQRNLESKSGLGLALNNLGIVHWLKGNYDLSKQYQLQSLEIFREISDLGGMGDACRMLGVVENTVGHLKEAQQWLNQALDIFLEVKLFDQVAVTYAYLAMGYHRLGERKIAEKHLLQGYSLSMKRPDVKGKVLNLVCQGAMARSCAKFEKAEGLCYEAIISCKEIDAVYLIGDVFLELAAVQIDKGEQDHARLILEGITENPTCKQDTRQSAEKLLEIVGSSAPGENEVACVNPFLKKGLREWVVSFSSSLSDSVGRV